MYLSAMVLLRPTVWPLQPESNNDVFYDGTDSQEGAGGASARPTLLSDRQEYTNMAAVPRISRPSLDTQVAAAASRRR